MESGVQWTGLSSTYNKPQTLTKRIFFNGWKHDHYVGAVIVFCPDGTIPIVCFNVPGSVHDSLTADLGSVYEKLEDVWERCSGKCTVDSAFSARRNEYLIRSSQTVLDGDRRAEFAFNLQLNKKATSMRQSAEWGVHAFGHHSSHVWTTDSSMKKRVCDVSSWKCVCFSIISERVILESTKFARFICLHLSMQKCDNFSGNFICRIQWRQEVGVDYLQ